MPLHHVHLRVGQGEVARALTARMSNEVVPVNDADVVIDLGGPGPDRRQRWSKDLQAGRSVVAASMDPADARWAQETWGEAARRANVVVLPNAGMAAVLGDCLASLAAEAAGQATQVHTGHLVAQRGGLLRATGVGARTEMAALLGRQVEVLDHGRFVLEPLGERRRLSWFARPVGPHHAAGVPCPEVVTIARHVPTAQTICGHLAMGAWRAEALQAVGSMARLDPVRHRMASWLTRARKAAEPARWAIVAEASGAYGVARAWANGTGLVEANAAVLSIIAQTIAARDSAGAPAPAQLVSPGAFLDDLASQIDLRWSVIRPE